MKVSFIIVTHNRCDALCKTLGQLQSIPGLAAGDHEIWLVDNASTDQTCAVVRKQFPHVQIIPLAENEGTAARSKAFEKAKGKYLILLDDDSYPIGEAVKESIDYMEQHPKCAAVVGKVVLPDGKLEACAMPTVMLSGAVCLRKSVAVEIGGFRPEFFRKAGEYDFSFRIWQAGYSIERFEDIVYRHDKVSTGRDQSFAHYMDLRNNLILVDRFLPRYMRRVYRKDWLQRYAAIARSSGHNDAITRGVCEARTWSQHEHATGRFTLSDDPLETLFEWNAQEQRIQNWCHDFNIQNVVIAGFGKNIYATYRACIIAQCTIQAIADDAQAFCGLHYRGIPVFQLDHALHHAPDGIVLSITSPAMVDHWVALLQSKYNGPILTLWKPRMLAHQMHPQSVL